MTAEEFRRYMTDFTLRHSRRPPLEEQQALDWKAAMYSAIVECMKNKDDEKKILEVLTACREIITPMFLGLLLDIFCGGFGRGVPEWSKVFLVTPLRMIMFPLLLKKEQRERALELICKSAEMGAIVDPFMATFVPPVEKVVKASKLTPLGMSSPELCLVREISARMSFAEAARTLPGVYPQHQREVYRVLCEKAAQEWPEGEPAEVILRWAAAFEVFVKTPTHFPWL